MTLENFSSNTKKNPWFALAARDVAKTCRVPPSRPGSWWCRATDCRRGYGAKKQGIARDQMLSLQLFQTFEKCMYTLCAYRDAKSQCTHLSTTPTAALPRRSSSMLPFAGILFVENYSTRVTFCLLLCAACGCRCMWVWLPAAGKYILSPKRGLAWTSFATADQYCFPHLKVENICCLQAERVRVRPDFGLCVNLEAVHQHTSDILLPPPRHAVD